VNGFLNFDGRLEGTVKDPRFLGTFNTPSLLFWEGRSLDAYLDALVRRNISHLVDVRKNALSMKYGFSKSQLSKTCAHLGITYIHEPDLETVFLNLTGRALRD